MCKHIYNPETQYPEGTPFTYFIGWSKLNKFYYGVRYRKNCHPDDIWNIYFTSSPSLWQFRIDNGEPDIVRVDFTYDTKEEALAYEEYILTKNDHAHNPNWINLQNGNKNFCPTEESIKKIADALRGRKQTPEHIANVVNATTGKKRSEVTKKKQSDAAKGKPKSAEHIKNSADARRGKTQSAETIKKRVDKTRGKKRTSEFCQRLSEINTGKKATEETKQKQSDAKKGRIWINNGVNNKMIWPEELQNYLDFGWKNGRLPRSKEFNQNISNAKKGKIMINNGEIQFFVTLEEAEIIYSFGFIKGKIISS